MNRIFLSTSILVFFLAYTPFVLAQAEFENASLGTSDEVFARQGDIVLTHGELDAAFNRVPVEIRLAYIRSGERVDQLVNSLLANKMLAAEAGDYKNEILVQKRMALMAEKELADAWMQRVLETAPKGEIEVLAHERYLANPQAFLNPEAVDVSHVLISNSDREDSEALELAQSVRQQIVDGSLDFDEAVELYSDDPSKEMNGGRFSHTVKGQMVAEFEAVSFTMETEGQISEPVQTAYGYHIIRLNKKIPAAISPFDDVKTDLMREARKEYEAGYKMRYMQRVLATPIEIDRSAVAEMAKRYFGEELELAPNFEE